MADREDDSERNNQVETDQEEDIVEELNEDEEDFDEDEEDNYYDYSNDKNDIDEILDKCADLKETDPGWIFKLSLGQLDVEQIKIIVEKMGRVTLNIGEGLTLLHLAAQYNRYDWIIYLCNELNHPLEVKTRVGETPLDQATWKGFYESTMFLIKFGADVDCQTYNGYSPLHRCAFYDHPKLAGLLCMAGANQKLRDENNQTPYEVAVEKGNSKVASILQPLITKEGVDITGIIYETNNPKHPNFRPEAREALWKLFVMEISSQADRDSEDGVEEDEVDDDNDDNDDNADQDEEDDGEVSEEVNDEVNEDDTILQDAENEDD